MSKQQIRYAGGVERCGPRRVGLLNPLGGETHKQGMHLDRWTKQKISNRKIKLARKVEEGHDQRGGVMQRQVKIWLEHGPALGSSM